MRKYLVIEQVNNKPYIKYIGLPDNNLDARQTKDEIIEMLIWYVRNNNLIMEQLNKVKPNVPYAVLKNGELYDVSQFVKTIKENRLF